MEASDKTIHGIARAVRTVIEKFFPSDPDKEIPAQAERDQTQPVEEGKRDTSTNAFLDGGEDLLDASRVRLFGVPFLALQLVPGDLRKYRHGNKLLESQLIDKEACLARIYGFSFEGQYTKLCRPSVFLVHGPGRSRLENRPASVTTWGTEIKEFQFADDVRVWEMDKEDVTLRLDVETGFLTDVLLDPMMNDDADLAGRQKLVARQKLVSRAEMVARHRARD